MPWDNVMPQWKAGTLRSGNKLTGPRVRSRKQTIAIMLSEKRKAAGNPEYRASKAPKWDAFRGR